MRKGINMTRVTKIAVPALFCAAFYASSASAQATRTWVSGVGDDVNPCSRTAPCKTFAGAISKTAAGGVINCLDPGGFGAVTITKALSIICQYTEAGVLVTLGSSGIIINAGANDHVYLRGMDIHGVGTGLNGVRFIAGASLTIEDSLIRRFNANNGNGISFQPSGASQLFVNNTTISNNGSAATGGGILVQPTGAGGTARVELRNVRLTGNSNAAFRMDTTGNTGFGIIVAVEDSQFSGSTTGISLNTPPATTSIQLIVNGSLVSNNTGTGISGTGGANRTRVGNSTISGNGTGVAASGGAVINSFGTNLLDGNGSDGTFTPPVIAPE